MCDHLGEYKLFTRHVNKVPIRVYHCGACNEQMTMDRLPRHLLRRMWGDAEKSQPIHDSMTPVDFCVIVAGKNALQLCRVFFWSLLRTAWQTHGITFHLVNNGVSAEEFDGVCKLIPGCRRYDLRPKGTPEMGLLEALEWEIKNCGTEKYIVQSHFDLFFAKDWVNRLRGMVTPKTGQLGSHCPFILLNREAFAQSAFKFRSIGPFKVVPDGTQCDIFTMDDPRGNVHYHCPACGHADSFQLGFDTGDCLELELKYRGWEVNPMRGPGLGDEAGESLYHFYGGARVTPDLNDGSEFVSIQQRAQMFIEEYQIP